jgi:hypothetical protein
MEIKFLLCILQLDNGEKINKNFTTGYKMKRIVELIKRINFCGYLIIAIVLSLPVAVVYAESVPYSFMPGEVISASEHNENFNYLAERSWGLSGTDLYYNDGNVSIGAIDPIRADRRLHIYDVDNPQLRLEKATGVNGLLKLSHFRS